VLAIAVVFAVYLLSAVGASAQWNPLNPVRDFQQQSDGVLFVLEKGALRLQVCTDNTVRLQYSPTGVFPEQLSYIATKTTWPQAAFTLQLGTDDVTLTTSQLRR